MIHFRIFIKSHKLLNIYVNLCIKIKKYIEIKNANDEKLNFVAQKNLLTFYNFLSMISNFVNVFRIEFKKIMTRDRNEIFFRKVSNTSELNRFRFCDFSSVFTDAVRTKSTANAAKITIVVNVVETMNANDASDATSNAAVTSLRKRALYDK